MTPPDQSHLFDLLLKGGRVIDPASGRDGLFDVGISEKKIAAVDANIPAETAAQVVDVTGLIVTPGIIDMHTHVYTYPPTPTSYVESMHADAHLFASGVTTTVDAGTAGWRNFSDFKASCIDLSKVRILAYLNIAGDGMVDKDGEQVVERNAAQDRRGRGRGVQRPRSSASRPRTTGRGCRGMRRIRPGPRSSGRWRRARSARCRSWWTSGRGRRSAPIPDLILKKLRPGDIHTHVFAQQFPIVDSQGKVYDHMWQARKRGVIFDLGHGAGSFWFRNAVPAFRDGFVPDSISTDFHMGNVNGPVLSMLTTMSKCLCMGMPLPEVIFRSTVTPAREIGRPELGTLSIGAEADVAVLKHLTGDFGYVDCGKAKLIGHEKLACALTIRAGQIVYDPEGLSVPEWEHAPAAYWRMPELQG